MIEFFKRLYSIWISPEHLLMWVGGLLVMEDTHLNIIVGSVFYLVGMFGMVVSLMKGNHLDKYNINDDGDK